MRAPVPGFIPFTDFGFTSSDGLRIACTRWESNGPSQAVFQIAHGMGEHIGRYLSLIEALVSSGFTVYGSDHRGHGRTARSAAELGDLGEGGFDSLVEDVVRLSQLAKIENPDLPLFLMGHSMGSFAAQQYIIEHSGELDGLILSGSGALDALALLARHVPPEMNFLNSHFEPSRTPLDWLSRDKAVVDAFINDPLCFPRLQPASFASFLAAAPRLAEAINLSRIRTDLPIYLLSGSEDPVGQQLKGIEILMARYHRARLNNITLRAYAGGQHEMLNETNSDDVRADLLDWMTSVLGRVSGTIFG
jgi:alpha-beta hydrolase superfamily lysophospholipase